MLSASHPLFNQIKLCKTFDKNNRLNTGNLIATTSVFQKQFFQYFKIKFSVPELVLEVEQFIDGD